MSDGQISINNINYCDEKLRLNLYTDKLYIFPQKFIATRYVIILLSQPEITDNKAEHKHVGTLFKL